MDKKGFMRTLEAIIAVIVVFIFIYAISYKGFEGVSVNVDAIESLQEEVLRGISEDKTMRDCVVNSEKNNCKGYLGKDLKLENLGTCCFNTIRDYVQNVLPERFKERHVFVICSTNNCGIPSGLPDRENVYTQAMVISSSLENSEYSPKIIRLWVW